MKFNNPEDYFNTDHLRLDLKGKAMRGAGATILTNALAFMAHIASTVILARLLTPDDYGLIAMVMVFSMLLQNFGLNGFTEAVIQKQDLNHGTMSTLFWTNATIMAALTIIFMLASPLFSWFYGEPRLIGIAIGISLSIFMSGMSTLHMAILRRNMHFHKAAAISLMAMFMSLTTSVILAWFGFGYWALVANTVLLPSATTLGAWFFCKWRPGKPVSFSSVVPLLKFALHTYANFSLNYFSRNIDKLLAGWQFGPAALGHYKKAYDLFTLPANQMISPINNVALATLSRLINEPEKFRHYYLSALKIIAFIGMPISAVLTLTGQDIILLILGTQWVKAGEIFRYFGASIGIMLITFTQGWLHLSLGKPERWLRWSIFQTIITTCFFIIGLQSGITGIAIAYTISIYILVIPCLWYAGRPIELKMAPLLAGTWRYFLAALASGGLSYTILYHVAAVSETFLDFHVFFRIILAFLMCGVLYLAFIIALYQSLSPIKSFFATARQMLPGRFRKTQ